MALALNTCVTLLLVLIWTTHSLTCIWHGDIHTVSNFCGEFSNIRKCYAIILRSFFWLAASSVKTPSAFASPCSCLLSKQHVQLCSHINARWLTCSVKCLDLKLTGLKLVFESPLAVSKEAFFARETLKFFECMSNTQELLYVQHLASLIG